ncbi:MAG: flotillin family protein [Deltaproteobacteria bacterium]|nr:flotillin family protein [Deltaproteobacteria bacterium]
MMNISVGIVFVLILAIFVLLSIISLVSRYRRCPSDKILVIYGKTGEGSARCVHGGAAFVWPLLQDYSYLDLIPISIEIPLQGALSKENIRISAPSTFTVGISTEPVVMKNAAERLLGLKQPAVRQVAEDIIFGQFRATIATMYIEEINKDREKFQGAVMESVEVELAKVGLRVINVNIKDLDDESGYIKALGQKAASEAINQARIDVAEQERKGQIGVAEADKEKAIGVAQAAKERDIGVAGADKEREIGLARAAQEREIGIAQADKEKEIGLADAMKEREIGIAQARKEQEIGLADAGREQRVGVAAADAEAVKGENVARQVKADSDAELREKVAEANRRGEVAEKTKEAEARRVAYLAEKDAENARAEKEKAARIADAVPLAEAEKQKMIIEADAQMERQSREGRGEGEKAKQEMLGRSDGMRALFEANSNGVKKLVDAAAGDANAAFLLLMADRVPELMNIQAKAVSNLKIDKLTVWDSGGKDGRAISNMVRDYATSLPPLQDLLKMTGVIGPGILGQSENQPEKRPTAEPNEEMTEKTGLADMEKTEK